MGQEELLLGDGGGVTRDAGSSAALILATFLGIGGIFFIAFYTHWYETVVLRMPEERQLAPHSLPPIVFCMMFLLLVSLNPLLHRLMPSLYLRRRELVIIFAMWLVASVITYASFINGIILNIGILFGPGMAMPAMERVGLLNYLPAHLFLPPEASREFYYGRFDGLSRIPFSAVPWDLWVGPLCFWVPFMLAALLIMSSLVQVVHRQWSRHELLSYPIASVADSLIVQRRDRAWPVLFYCRGFWIGFAVVGGIYLLNGFGAFFPSVPRVPMSYWHSDLVREFRFLQYGSTYAFSLFRGLVHPYMIAIAVLLPTELSLTSWLGWVLLIFGTALHFQLTGDTITEKQSMCAQWGMMLGIVGFLALVGWREYARILRCAFTLRRDEDTAIRDAAIACRVLVMAMVALVGLFIYAGLDWLLAIVLVCAFALVVIVMARITAEMGFPFLWSFIGMSRFLPWKLLGPGALGPRSMAVMAVIGGMLDIHPGNTLPANETTYRKLEEGTVCRLPRQRFNLILLLAAVVSIAAGIVAHLWDDYSYGANRELVGRTYLRKWIVDPTAGDISRVQLEGKAEQLDATTGLAKLRLAAPEPGFVRYLIYGFVLVGGCAFMRLRFSWWPFHPLPLLFLNTWILSRLYFSFFLGWCLKTGLTRIGGGKVFVRSKPFFFGVIAGQVVISCLWLFVGGIYYVVTGEAPPRDLVGYII